MGNPLVASLGEERHGGSSFIASTLVDARVQHGSTFARGFPHATRALLRQRSHLKVVAAPAPASAFIASIFRTISWVSSSGDETA